MIQVIQVWAVEEHRPVIVVIWFPENIITHYPSQLSQSAASDSQSLCQQAPASHQSTLNMISSNILLVISLSLSLSDNITCNIPAV